MYKTSNYDNSNICNKNVNVAYCLNYLVNATDIYCYRCVMVIWLCH